MKSTERIEIHEQLGAGSMGVVFRATDRLRGEEVALKTLQRADPAAIVRFKQEFRALADVAHRNLVTLHDLIVLDGQWCFTMELVRGVDFLEHIRASGAHAGGGAKTWTVNAPTSAVTRLRAALTGLAQGISALHKARKLHCDIKPSNVMVDHNDRVVLLDFGLVTDLSFEPWHRQVLDQIAGSVAYMAPERALRRSVTEAADWYSFGVLLYEALTGRLPFEGDAARVLAAKQERDPLPPRHFDKSTPRDLNDLCVSLLCREPSGRPAAPEILARLEGRRAPRASAWISLPESAFVGRSSELAAMADAFEEARQGRAVTLLVSGASGMGKSTLVRRFTDGLKRRGQAVVFDGRCYEREWVPYKTLDSLVDRLAEHLLGLAPSEAAELVPDDFPLLAHVFPALSRVPFLGESKEPPGLLPDRREFRRRAFGALGEILRRIARRAPLVLLIDDLQWGDADSVGPLADVFSPPSPLPALMIVCFRDADAETSPSLRALLQRLESGPVACELRRLKLEPLPSPESSELLKMLLGEDFPGAHALADTIALEASGSPLILQELVKHAQIKGGSQRTRASLPPTRLGDVIHERMSMLLDGERRLLEVIALAGYPLREDAAVQAAGLTESPSSAIANLRALRLVLSRPTDQGTQLEAYHDRIREAVTTKIPPDVRRRRHGELARALDGLRDVEPQLLAEHYREAGETRRAAHFTLVAAEQAANALAFNRAAALYRLALDLGVDSAPRWEIFVKLGEVQANAGKGKAAAASFVAAAEALGEASPDARRALDLKRCAAEQYLRSGYIEEGIAILRDVLAAVGVHYPRTPSAALASIVVSRVYLGAQPRLRSLNLHARSQGPMSETDRLKLDAYFAASRGLALVDNVRAAHFQLCHQLLAQSTGDPTHLARSLVAEVAFLAAEGGASNRRRCSKALAAAEELASRSGDPYFQMLASLCASVASFYSGAWRIAFQRSRETERIGRERCTGITWEMNCAEQVELCALTYLGELSELSTRLPELLKEARERDDVLAEANLRLGVPNMAWLAEDRPDEAEAQARLAMQRWTSSGFTSQRYLEVIATTQIDLYRHDGSSAFQRMKDAWPKLRYSLLLRLQAVRIELLHLRARAALTAVEARTAGGAAVGSGFDRKRLLSLAAADARRLAAEDLSIAAPFVALIRAGVASLSGNEALALNELRDADDACARSEMGLYRMAARAWKGMLLGGDAGRAEQRESVDWMRVQGVTNPTAMAAMLVPGFRRLA